MALWCGLMMAWLVGCNRPCATSADCNGDGVCAAALCRALSCEEAIFAIDPKTGACVPLSGCFLTAEQRSWQTCQDDPCVGLSETSCLADARCQPGYASMDPDSPYQIKPQPQPDGKVPSCGESTGPTPTSGGIDPNGSVTAPGVHSGDQPKHGGSWDTGCILGRSRKFAGCRAAPQITPQPPCSGLTTEQCQPRTDCLVKSIWSPISGQESVHCIALHERGTTSCNSADEMSCLTNPDCQPIGALCYCPRGATCDCRGGEFFGCGQNDRLRRCTQSADCNAGERCDNDEDCLMPRTYATTPPKLSGPGAVGCVGTCVPTGCAGMGEQRCNQDPACDAGSYHTVCHPKPNYSGLDASLCPQTAASDNDQGSCGCASEFFACAAQSPSMNIRSERSLLVRDAEIIDDPTFSLESVLTQLAPAGLVDAFADSLLSQVGAGKQLANGAITTARSGFAKLYQELNRTSPQLAERFSAMMATTALVNRLDLATTRDCGEARISFAMLSAYTNGNQRMTLIVELKVPDDGNGCTVVAQQWAELSLIDDLAQRRTKLIALYRGLLQPANLGQIRTNEFVNRTGRESWEMREFHLRRADGLLDLVPVAQTVNPMNTGTPALLSWLTANAASLQAGTAMIPTQFLAGASTENGGRLKLLSGTTDPSVREVEKLVNELACAGCHLTETQSPFVHIGERLATKVGRAYRPTGRAVIDDFLKKELIKRTEFLNNVLAGSSGLVAAGWRQTIQPRVH